MRKLARESSGQSVRTLGFTMLEMLVVLILIIALMVFVIPTWNRVPARMSAALSAVKAIQMASEAYAIEFGAYPSPTGFVAPNGSTTPFAAGEKTEADALARYLCTTTTDPKTGRSIGPFLSLGRGQSLNVNLPSGPTQLLIDPFGRPYRLDVVKDASGKPCVRVWSLGPDGQEGPVPFSRVQPITDPRDQDNIGSWR